MTRRTPILAFLLAPVALILLVQLWTHAVVPLTRSVWYGDTALQWRLDSQQPATRIAAARAVGSVGSEDPELLADLVARAETDPSAEVRKAAFGSLGQLGSMRPLPADALEALSTVVSTEQDVDLLSVAVRAVGRSAPNNRYSDPIVERIAAILGQETLAPVHLTAVTALEQIGSAQPLPVVTLELLADAFEQASDSYLRRTSLLALAHGAAYDPRALTLITQATQDADPSVASAAKTGLRILEHERAFRGRDPLTLATDPSQPLKVRLDALRILRSTPIDPVAFGPIAALAQDSEPEVAVAVLGMFHYLARAPEDDFDRGVLIPALAEAMSDPDPRIREAAYGALSSISVHRPAYPSAAEFPARLEAGAQDPNPRVRVIALLAMVRDADGAKQRETILERGLTDPDPYVRRMAVGWLSTPKIKTGRRQEHLARALADPDPGVRATATASQEDWGARERTWPIELWQLWRAGERGQVGLRILTAVTIATPVLICGIFLLYYVARLLALLAQRRWRAAAVVPIVAVWAAASYGMFLVYFMAGHAGDVDGGELAILAAILWGAIVVYTALGWGLHFAVRR